MRVITGQSNDEHTDTLQIETPYGIAVFTVSDEGELVADLSGISASKRYQGSNNGIEVWSIS